MHRVHYVQKCNYKIYKELYITSQSYNFYNSVIQKINENYEYA